MKPEKLKYEFKYPQTVFLQYCLRVFPFLFRISKSFPVQFLHHPDHRIQRHRHDAQQDDGH